MKWLFPKWKVSLFCNESMTEEVGVSFLFTCSLGDFLPIFKCFVDTLDDFLCLYFRNEVILVTLLGEGYEREK